MPTPLSRFVRDVRCRPGVSALALAADFVLVMSAAAARKGCPEWVSFLMTCLTALCVGFLWGAAIHTRVDD